MHVLYPLAWSGVQWPGSKLNAMNACPGVGETLRLGETGEHSLLSVGVETVFTDPARVAASSLAFLSSSHDVDTYFAIAHLQIMSL